ncbi:MAG: TAXI family TRAP transporter solute-binding subunit [Alphaproteobacteria bacterium]
MRIKHIASILSLYIIMGLFSPAWGDSYRFNSGPQGGNWFVLGGAISAYFTEDGLQTSSSTGGGVANIINVNNGKADFGFSVGSLVGAAHAGEETFKGKVENAVIFANLYPQITYFVARKDFVEKNNIKTLKDIFAVPKLSFATLKPGTSSEFVIRSLFHLAYDQDWKKLKQNGAKVQFTSYSDGAGLMGDGHIDVFAFSVGEKASIILNIESQVDVVLLPVDEEALQILSKNYGTSTFNVEPGFYKSVTSSVPTVGDYTVLITNKNIETDVISKAAESLYKNADNLAATVKDFSAFSAAAAISTLPMHEAAKQYWQQQAD